MVENHLRQRELSTAEASANALREDFFHLINGQQDMQDHLNKLKSNIFDQLDNTLSAVNSLQNSISTAEANRITARGRLGSASSTASRRGSNRGQSASPTAINRTRKSSSLFNKESSKNDIANARAKFLNAKLDKNTSGSGPGSNEDFFPSSTPLGTSMSSPFVGNRRRLPTT